MPEIEIYTDGAYNWEVRHGGWAAKIMGLGAKPLLLSGREEDTTNNRMEMTAAIKALEKLPKSSEVTLYSDSEYLVKSMKGHYRRKANLDLWNRLDELAAGLKVRWEWVRGHAGNSENEEVDVIATREAGMLPGEGAKTEAKSLTHVDEKGQARMVDVGWKGETEREAVAKGSVVMSPEAFQLLKSGNIQKGDALAVARIAGIAGAKRTPDLIPLAHPIPLTHVSVELALDEAKNAVNIRATAKATAKTGVEMEALTAVMTAALTLYDMCKSVDRGIHIEGVRLVSKRGGRSGEINLEEEG